MKQALIKIGILVLVILLNISCKKYDEGPWISLRSKESRMSGEWRNISKFMVNGYDSTAYFTNYKTAYFNFNVDWSGQLGVHCDEIPTKPTISLKGKWNWENNKGDISIEFYDSYGDLIPPFSPFAIDNSCIWEIKKLKKKEFYLETTDNGVHYRLELTR